MSEIVSISSLGQAAAGSEARLDQARNTSGPVSADSASLEAIATEHGDSVALSSAASQVQQALSAGADTRAARVQQLRQQIETGQYAIDPVAIGNAVLDAGVAGE
jgi:flagellar biosynthesis anti-sigma factor FlgM